LRNEIRVHDAADESFSHLGQHSVTNLMTESIIDLLEMIEVDEHHCNLSPASSGIGKCGLAAVIEQGTIAKSSEWIEFGLLYEIGCRFALSSYIPHRQASGKCKTAQRRD
jgi:hypothetical protein